jgi:hypothetical protein
MFHNGSGSPLAPIDRPRRPERALAVAALAAVLFLQPFLGLFDLGATATLAGVPILYVYLFAAWSAVVALTALVMEPRQPPEAPSDAGAQLAPELSAGVAGSETANTD